jgi:hypothetical protein
MNRRLPIAGLMLLACTAVASAASFEVVSGEGAINLGLGFKPVTGKIAVKPGSTLHIPAGAQGFLIYDNGCRVRVTSGAFVRVQKNAPCDASGRDLPAAGATNAQQQDSTLLGGVDPLTLGVVELTGLGGLAYGISEVNKNNKNQFVPTQLSP